MYVRPNWKATIEQALPYSARVLQQAYRSIPGQREVYVEVPIEPPSVNHLYRQLRNKKTGKPIFKLEDNVLAFREMVKIAFWGKSFPMRALGAAIIGIESPRWVTKEHKVSIKDADNPVKCVFDGIKYALGYEDELFWEFFPFKVMSKRGATHIWLYELGDVVNAVGGLKP